MRPAHRAGMLVLTFAVGANTALAVVTAGQLPPCSTRPGKSLPQRCELTDQMPPPTRAGGVDDAQYCFGHISDAESAPGGTTTYRRWLTNWHNTNILDAEWKKADIQFNSIAPRDCALRLSSSGRPPREDGDAPVRYGRVKDGLIVKPAIVHADTFAAQTKVYPSLTGMVYAGLLLTRPGAPERFVVDVATRSDFKDKQILLQVENRGDANLIYSVPELAGRLGKPRFDAAVEKSTWRRVIPGSDWFQMAGGVTVANLVIDDIGTVAEERVGIQFAHISDPNTVLGRVSVPAYVPPSAK